MSVRRARALVAGLLLFPSLVLAQPQPPPPEVQQLLEKSQREPLSAEEQQRISAYYQAAAQQQMDQLYGPVPPEVKAIQDKANRGEKPSDEEMQKLQDYYLHRRPAGAHFTPHGHGRGEGAPPGRAPGDEAPGFSPDHVAPAARPDLHLEKRAVPTREQYLSLVATVIQETSAALPPGVQAQIDGLVAKGKRGTSALALGALLSLSSDGPAASAYASALAAKAEPESALAANNLGAALKDAHFYERSVDALLWANKLRPNTATILTNLAFDALYLGDLTYADSLFQRALQLDPADKDALTGLALLGKASGAPRSFIGARKALAKGFSDIDAMLAVDTEGPPQDEQVAQMTPIADEPGALSTGALVLEPGQGSDFDYPVWEVPTGHHEMAGMLGTFGGWVSGHQGEVASLQREHQAAQAEYRQASQARMQQLMASGGKGYTVPIVNPRAILVFDDLTVIYNARARQAMKPFNELAQKTSQTVTGEIARLTEKLSNEVRACGDNDHCVDEAKYRYCSALDVVGNQTHAPLYAQYNKSFHQVQGLLGEYWRKSAPWVESIADPKLQRSLDLQRQLMVRTHFIGDRSEIPSWSFLMSQLSPGHCAPPPPPKPKDVAAASKDAKTPAAKKTGKCAPQPGQFGMGAVSLSWDCDSFTLQGGEGLFGGITQRFHGPSGHAETTVFAGFGEEAAFGMAKGEAKAVISFTQSQGRVVDVGAEYTTEASAKGFGSEIKAGTDIKWSMRSGADMGWDAAASWQGHPLGGMGFHTSGIK